ncbi:hypothetical protein [Paracoccus sp. (in: a-proteobacteria)]|uniref:hypothetical protein n=1 Tax=Paracoccus sp. TaxID=267 RepID=UPI002AFEC7BE|nr:hypothetical protein [Paracoccus sp. (in: a-proteobacteria)]
MNAPQFEFKGLKLSAPINNVSAAISILQMHIMAQCSEISPDVAFGGRYSSQAALEAVVALLDPVADAVEDQRWEE